MVSSFRRNSSPGGAFHRSLHSQCLHSAHLPLDDEHASNDNENKLDLPVWIQTSNRLTVDAIKAILVILIPEDRPFGRFYALETIARVPYFSYTSVLHLYETLGWFRKSEYIKIHFAESWNELHHLKIMESLGGNSEFKDRQTQYSIYSSAL